MTRGPSWDAYELQIAAKAYKIATQNRTRGADQTSVRFGDHIFRLVKELQPHDLKDTDLRYGNRPNGRQGILIHLKNKVFPDITKFGKRVLTIENKKPTGNVNEKDIHCMAIANHLTKCSGLNYDYCTFGSKAFNPVTEWKHYLAYMELRLLTKFDKCPHKTIIENHNKKLSSIEKAATLKKQKKNGSMDDIDSDDDNDNNDDDDDADNLPIQDENVLIDSEDDENNDENDENMKIDNNVLVPQNDASINFSTPARMKDKNKDTNNNNNRAAKGIKNSKLEVKQKHQFDAGLKAIKSVGADITKLVNNVDFIRDVLTTKAKRKDDAEMMKLLKSKYKMLITKNPVEADKVLTKINEINEKRLHELERNSNDDK